MDVTLWGTRGSLATPGPDTARYGGNTSCVCVRGPEGTVIVLDAGTGVRRMAATIPDSIRRIDVLLTHLHMDHIQGLGFFAPLYRSDMEVHIWGPASTNLALQARLRRYLSPPLFPVGLREVPCRLHLHEVSDIEADIGEFRVSSARVCHPGPTVGYRIRDGAGHVLVYLPDHEPALGVSVFPQLPRAWTSGGVLAENADLLIHDSQYSAHEYPDHVGWGHSSLRHVLNFGTLVEAKHLVPFHHDPSHSDADLDRLMAEAIADANPAYRVTPGREGLTFRL
ncbi:MAG TPA: MBL fold metallo-hydrolase [Burkholderiales bacterium]|nr:MBL fold metallo-hydrolase [Burkholderiales bacterium]